LSGSFFEIEFTEWRSKFKCGVGYSLAALLADKEKGHAETRRRGERRESIIHPKDHKGHEDHDENTNRFCAPDARDSLFVLSLCSW